MNLENSIKELIREIPDFPRKGILFKDITPILLDPLLCEEIVQEFCKRYRSLKIDAVVSIESRGFFFGSLIANRLNVPFIPARKKGKLPYHTISTTYELEYGTAEMEIHTDAIHKGWNVLVHDDLLATGGTAEATLELVRMASAVPVACSFLVELLFLNGRHKLTAHSNVMIDSLVSFS